MSDSDQESDFSGTSDSLDILSRFLVDAEATHDGTSDTLIPLFPEDILSHFLVDADATRDGCPDNPTKIDKPFWKYMIARPNLNGYVARKKLGLDNVAAYNKGPVFCFQRMGMTETKLPDGRVVYIGGEHEDFYDPDFFIYNNVVVVRGESDEPGNTDEEVHPRPEDIDIYGYPTDVFLPTDFHTATYYKDESSGKEYIYIIGGLGYEDGPHRERTITHRLDLQDFSIRRLETGGNVPPQGDPEEEREARGQGDTIVFSGSGISDHVLSLTDMQWSEVQ
jgi:hypothetical protein